MSNSWGTRVHLPSCQEHTHSPGFIPKSPRTWFPERQTGERCTTQVYALLRSWFFCQSSVTLLADDGPLPGANKHSCSAARLSVCLSTSRDHRGRLTSDHLRSHCTSASLGWQRLTREPRRPCQSRGSDQVQTWRLTITSHRVSSLTAPGSFRDLLRGHPSSVRHCCLCEHLVLFT